jgi:hypothetical protein
MVVRYSHDGRMLAVGGRDFSQLFLSRTGERLAELEFDRGDVTSISFSCDDLVLATASGSTICLWDVTSGSLITTLVGDGPDIDSADFHPSIGHLLVAGDEDGRVYIWDVRDSSRTDFNVADGTGSLCWVQQRKQKRIIVGCKDGRVEMWDVDSLERVQVFSSSQSDDSTHVVASSDDGSLVASGSRNGTLAVYSTHTGEVLHSHQHIRPIYSVAFLPTAPILAFASEEEVGLWFYATDCIVTFTGHLDAVNSVAFSPHGRFIASASADHTLRIWETSTTDPAPDNIHHSYEIHHVHFSNDGQLIVSASNDKTVKVWDTLTGTLCATHKPRRYTQDVIVLSDNVHVVFVYSYTLIVWNWQKHETLFRDAIAYDHGLLSTLHTYMHIPSPLGFISTHAKSDDSQERTVCCWTVDLSVPGNTCIVLVACGVVSTSKSNILQITQRGSTLVLECDSGKQFSALRDGADVVGNGPVKLQFVEEREESLLKDIKQPLTGSELPCRLSGDRAWILDKHDRQILWVPPANRGSVACWYEHCLVIGGTGGRLTLVDFLDVILSDNIEF